MAYTTNKGRADIFDRYINGGAAAEFRLMLVTTAPANAAAAADLNFVTEVAGVEATFTNYARKTVTLTFSEDDTNDVSRLLLAATQTYANAGGATNNTVVGGWIFRRATPGSDTAATDILLIFVDFANATTDGGTLSLSASANGVATLAPPA